MLSVVPVLARCFFEYSLARNIAGERVYHSNLRSDFRKCRCSCLLQPLRQQSGPVYIIGPSSTRMWSVFLQFMYLSYKQPIPSSLRTFLAPNPPNPLINQSILLSLQLPTPRHLRQQIPRLQRLIGRMSQRPLRLRLHLMSSTMCMLPIIS